MIATISPVAGNWEVTEFVTSTCHHFEGTADYAGDPTIYGEVVPMLLFSGIVNLGAIVEWDMCCSNPKAEGREALFDVAKYWAKREYEAARNNRTKRKPRAAMSMETMKGYLTRQDTELRARIDRRTIKARVNKLFGVQFVGIGCTGYKLQGRW